MSTHNIPLLVDVRKYFPNYRHLLPDLAPARTTHISNRTNFHGPKDDRAIEVRLYLLFSEELNM